MTDRLQTVLDRIDLANSADPNTETVEGGTAPAALLYGQRMSEELARLCPGASDHLRIAARGQHIERWKLKRQDYPEGRTGYLTWRRDQAAGHAERVGEIMRDAGYDAENCTRTGRLLRKEGIKRDPEVQMLEDTICFTFVRWYLEGFTAKHPAEKVTSIVTKTARKMSAEARALMLAEFPMPDHLAAAFAE